MWSRELGRKDRRAGRVALRDEDLLFFDRERGDEAAGQEQD